MTKGVKATPVGDVITMGASHEDWHIHGVWFFKGSHIGLPDIHGFSITDCHFTNRTFHEHVWWCIRRRVAMYPPVRWTRFWARWCWWFFCRRQFHLSTLWRSATRGK